MKNLFWQSQLSHNLGDRLSPIIFQMISGEKPIHVTNECEEPYYSFVGSHLGAQMGENATIWGTGILRSKDKPSPEPNYLAVRGPLTREAVLRYGGECSEIYGDPLALLPKYLPLPKGNKTKIGISLHWREKENVKLPDDSKFIALDIQSDTMDFLANLSLCESVLSSSLHGLIISHAYGVPATWIQPTNEPLGDGVKFRDYLLSVDLNPSPSSSNFKAAVNDCCLPKFNYSEGFLRSCPVYKNPIF